MACRALLARAIAPLSAAALSMPQLCRAVPTCALPLRRIYALSMPWRRIAGLINACAVLRRALQCLALAVLASGSRASAAAMLAGAMLNNACALLRETSHSHAIAFHCAANQCHRLANNACAMPCRAVLRTAMPVRCAHRVAVRRIACARSSPEDLRRRCAELCSASAMLPAALPARSTGQGCYAAALLCRSLLCCAGAPLCYAVRTNACASLRWLR